MSTVQTAMAAANAALTEAGVLGAVRDTRRLMAACLEVAPDRMMLHTQDPLGDVTEAAFFAMIQLRIDRMPVSRILGFRAFYGRDFTITPDVLDPRPETETLIAQALSQHFDSFVDLGTGSGAIAVTLLAERPAAKGIATDISQAALSVAAQNAQRHCVDDRLGLIGSAWLDDVDGTFDLIISNPPYIAAGEMDALARDVREHDPWIALTDDADGLSAYRIIAASAPLHLTSGGRLMVEIGPTQAADVIQMFNNSGLHDVQVAADLDGRDRVICGQKP